MRVSTAGCKQYLIAVQPFPPARFLEHPGLSRTCGSERRITRHRGEPEDVHALLPIGQKTARNPHAPAKNPLDARAQRVGFSLYLLTPYEGAR
jgi:hypothetical protein